MLITPPDLAELLGLLDSLAGRLKEAKGGPGAAHAAHTSHAELLGLLEGQRRPRWVYAPA